jgi:predicted ester cyclase
MLNGTSYDITTTAPYSGPITVCIKYDPATMANPSNEQNLKLFHLNGSVWQDITTSVDTIAKKVCGLTDSLSPFLIAEPTTDTTPDPFSFIDQTGVALNTAITSNAIALSVINAPSAISVNGGQYSINNGAFTSAAGTVNNGNSVRVQLTSSANYATMTSATLTIGGVSGTFSVTTMTFTGYFTITASAGPNGSILPSGAVSVRKGAIQIFLIIPNMGYHIADVLVDGVSVGAQLLYTFKNVQANHTISATFAANTGNTITASAGPNGSISPSGAVTVLNWASQTFTITPDAGYRVADVLVDGTSVGARTSFTFYLVRSDHTISASFTPDVYTITATAGPNGRISPSGAVTVNRGDSATFTITPDAGHVVRRVVVDGDNKGAITTYTFKNVRANHTIDAYFR